MASIETERRSDEKNPEAAGDAPVRRLLRFHAAGTACACDLDTVHEIVRGRPAARLPGAAPWVLGIMNVRGRLLTVGDVSARLGGARRRAPAFVMVLELAGRRFGLGVESVQGVADVPVDAIGPVDATHASGGLVGGLAHLPDGAMAQWFDIEVVARELLAV